MLPCGSLTMCCTSLQAVHVMRGNVFTVETSGPNKWEVLVKRVSFGWLVE